MKQLFFILLLPILFIVGINAQVTIGSGIPPEKAALLDIKSHQPEKDGGATTQKGGILLPRVNLSDINELSPFINKNDYSPEEYDKYKKRHTGLVVYNLSATSGFEPGTYVWQGSKWLLLRDNKSGNTSWSLTGNGNTDPARHYVGTADARDLIIKTNNAERIRITADGKIGIHTSNPQKQLEVTGETQLNNQVFLGNTPKAPDDGISQLVKDNKTGQVYYVSSSTGNTKTFNYLTYSVSNLETGDWINDLDTQIPVNEYTLIVVGSTFETEPSGKGLRPSTSSDGTYNPQSVYAFKKGQVTGNPLKTWHLNADFIGGVTASLKSGTWQINCIAINNSVVKVLPDIIHNMGGSSTGKAPKPQGL